MSLQARQMEEQLDCLSCVEEVEEQLCIVTQCTFGDL